MLFMSKSPDMTWNKYNFLEYLYECNPYFLFKLNQLVQCYSKRRSVGYIYITMYINITNTTKYKKAIVLKNQYALSLMNVSVYVCMRVLSSDRQTPLPVCQIVF